MASAQEVSTPPIGTGGACDLGGHSSSLCRQGCSSGS